jgi:hypothetical protein
VKTDRQSSALFAYIDHQLAAFVGENALDSMFVAFSFAKPASTFWGHALAATTAFAQSARVLQIIADMRAKGRSIPKPGRYRAAIVPQATSVPPQEDLHPPAVPNLRWLD